MKIFNAKQVYSADKFTIEKQKISSNELMERAALQLFNWLHSRLQGAPVKIHLFCGIGNNGGDGLVLARHLQEHGYYISVYIVNYSEKRSEDFLITLDRLKERKVWPEFLESGSDLPTIGADDIVVDAIFGIGLNRTPDDWVISLISHINASKAFILSVDIPSGLFTERIPERMDAVIMSNYVLSFQLPKLVFFLPQTGKFVEQWETLDIGLDPEFLSNTKAEYEFIAKNEVIPAYRPREKFSHKGTYGHTLLIGGSYGKIGAILLASSGALKVGSGLVTAYIPECGYTVLQTGLPEAMVITNGKKHIDKIIFDCKPTAIAIGTGLGTYQECVEALHEFLKRNKVPLVIDADALNILSENKNFLGLLPDGCILTPHPKELERLLGAWKDDFDKLEKAKAFARKYNCVLVIKGANTLTTDGNVGYINGTGNPGMATGGSGDVLTGIIAGLMAQGYESLEAAVFGVYLHGRAGDISVASLGYEALTAKDIINGIGKAYLDLFEIAENNMAQQDVDSPT